MPSISDKNREKIAEQILSYLFSTAPEARFTVDIARELVRDEEFVKSLLEDLAKKHLVVLVNKNAQGESYVRRQRWRLSNSAYDVYRRMAQKPSKNVIDEDED